MYALYVLLAWMGIVAVRNFAATFYRLGTKKDVVTSWKVDAAGSFIAAILSAVLILAWFEGW